MGTLHIEVWMSGDLMVVSPVGVLAMQTAPRLRAALSNAVAEQPKGVIVDMRSVEVATPELWSVFGPVARTGADTGVRLVVVAGTHDRQVQPPAAVTRNVGVYPTITEARAALSRPPGPRLVRRRIPHGVGTLAPVRAFVESQCTEWSLDAIAADAVAIAHELVSNALRHAGTDAVLRLDLRRGTLTVAVSDGDPAPPLLTEPEPGELRTGGYGLLIVRGLARGWGTAPVGGGKLVWATLTT